MEPTLIICPLRRFRIIGKTRLTSLTTPKKLVSNCDFASIVEVSSIAPVRAYPALLTSTSRLPAWSTTSLTHVLTESSESTSSVNIWKSRRPAFEGSLLVPNTTNPLEASNEAVASPSPEDAPVTSTVRGFATRFPRTTNS